MGKAPAGRVLIDGTLRAARSGATLETINPATEEVLGVAADYLLFGQLDRRIRGPGNCCGSRTNGSAVS